jgi:hypothetical protein
MHIENVTVRKDSLVELLRSTPEENAYFLVPDFDAKHLTRTCYYEETVDYE